ncbi:rnase p subunit p30 [Diaporthe amygdali]|uniref:rnase p subunit p30 n=1 Tax=Phomopsis amygdali TaxID=1214568 RepID=UPI0022FE8F16|nr:rnase p subunit p30 [Diaporthe amygdali]KAJ0104152.1 rnase p subunit p30 [Diaporthe amygdali]
MLYDLNIHWTPQTPTSELERTLKFSASLGYNVVAINHTFSAPIPSQINNPIPHLGPIHSSFPQHNHHQPSSTPNPTSDDATASKLPTTLRRATVIVSDPTTNYRLPSVAAAYDILACRPTTDKAFSAACTTMSEISMISLDLTQFFPFHFKPKPCMAAVNRGVYFEICYGQLVGSSDQRARSVWIANVIELLRATRGRGIVLSSEGKGAGSLRAPADVVNLLAVWGLGPEKGLESLGVKPRAVVVNEGLKRRAFKGVVDIVDSEGKIPGRDTEGKDAGGDHKKNQTGKKQQGQNQQQPKGKNEGGKRKHEGGGDDGGGGDQTSLPVMSKRQAKKMKLADKKAVSESTKSSK